MVRHGFRLPNMRRNPEERRAAAIARARILVLACAALLGLGIAEVALRALECRRCGVSDFALVRERYLGNRLAIFPDESRRGDGLRANTVIGDSIRVNNVGLRGRDVELVKPAGRFRVLCLGGSSVFGTSSPDDASTWPAFLQMLAVKNGTSGCEVLNGGVPSFHSDESVARFERQLLPLRADVAILCNEHNDLLYRRLYRLSYDPRGDACVTVCNGFERLLSHSAIYLRLRALLSFRARTEKVAQAIARDDARKGPAAVGDDVRAAPLPESGMWSSRAGFQREALAAEARGCRAANPYFAAKDLEDYRANLMRFIRVCREHGIRPVLAKELLAFELDAGAEPYRTKGAPILTAYFPDYERFREAYGAYHRVLREVAESEGVLLLDAEDDLPREEGVFTDHVHLSAKGCRLLAAIFERKLRAAGVLAPPASGR